MLIFLYGSDAYRLQQTKQTIVEGYRKKHSSGVNIFDFDLSDTSSLVGLFNAIKSSSFFNEHKLLVCRNPFNNRTAASTLFEYINKYNLQSASDLTLVIIGGLSEKDLTLKHKELFKLLSDKSGIIKNIEILDGTKLSEWLRNEFHLRKCSISNDALRFLTVTVGNEGWALINEVEKLCTYKDGGDITIADISLLTVPRINLNIFDFTDALGRQNRNKALELLYYELKTGRDPYYLLTMATHYFRNLILVKDLQKQKCSELEIAKKTKLHPFVIKKAVKSPFRFEEPIQIYGRLLSIDIGFKLGRLDLEDSLYDLAMV